MLVDSHAHLEVIDDLQSAFDRAKVAGVDKIITVGTSMESSKQCIEIAKDYSNEDLKIYATCGIHPKDGKADVDRLGLFSCFKTLKQLAISSKSVIGVGEAGLDYYPTTTGPEKKFQRELFEEQIKLARELKLPLVVHCRNAWDKIFRLLTIDNRQSSLKGVFHSWTGDWNAAKKALALGFYLSFSGIVTFKQSLRSSTSSAGLKNARQIQEVAKKAPLDRILIETDSPFLTPSPLRGELNEPKNVRIVGKFIADLRNQSFGLISATTSKNAQKLFKI